MRCDWCHKDGAGVVKLLDAVPVVACGPDHAEMVQMGAVRTIDAARLRRYNGTYGRPGAMPITVGTPAKRTDTCNIAAEQLIRSKDARTMRPLFVHLAGKQRMPLLSLS